MLVVPEAHGIDAVTGGTAFPHTRWLTAGD
jgi:hypothetical protein